MLRWPDQRRYQRPFVIGQIGRIPQPSPIRRSPMLHRPRHATAPRIARKTSESQPIQAIQFLFG
jgi:hypothetical protein